MGVNAQRFAPALDPARFLLLTDPALQPAATIGGGVLFNVASDPLVLRYDDPDRANVDVLDRVGTADLRVWRTTRHSRLGVDLPVHLLSSGVDVEGFRVIGDARLELDAELVQRDGDGFGLGARVLGVLPTGRAEDWLGSSRAELGLGLTSAVAAGPALVALNTTIRSGSHDDLALTPDWAAALDLGAGTSVALSDAVSLSGELTATWLLGASAYAAPVEALFGIGLAPVPDLRVHLGGGAGLTSGLGAPDWRGVLGVSWSPQPAAPPAPTPAPAAAAPAADSAPIPSQLAITARDPDGRLLAVQIRLTGPTGASTLDAPEGAANATLPPGSYALVIAAEGHVPLEKAVALLPGATVSLDVVVPSGRAQIAGDRILLADRIYFETDSDAIRAQSYPLLDEIATLLLQHPELTSVAVAGHADDQGSADHNLDLSLRRSLSVCNYLVRSGVARDRLLPVGQGESLPLVLGDTDDARAANRRVEFRILETQGAQP